MLHIVTGSSGCGKSTWVRHTAKPGDIIIGSDELTNALTGKTESKHHHDGVAKKVSAAAREAAINEAIKHRTTTDVWLLISNLTDREAAKYRRFNAHIIVIDPGYDLAMQRCRDNRPGYKHRLVDSWYNKRSEWPRDAEIINPPLITNHDNDDDVLPTTKGATNIHVVTGPPAAGKSTYIRTKWQQGDVLIDFDTIANELAGVEPANHTHPQHIKLITKAARQAAIDASIKHAGDHTVWIIHSSPSDKLLDRYRTLGAVIDVVDPGKDVVMKRCKAERPPEMLKIAAAWYSKHAGVKPKRAKSTTERGYGWQHQQARESLLRKHKDGSLCWWCGKPMYKDKTKNFDGKALARDHLEAEGARRGSHLDRLLHFTCNSQRQDGSNDHLRPAIAHQAPSSTTQKIRERVRNGVDLGGLAFQ
ncbi:hypothetical protein KbCgl_18580 [Corynebacterium glutamicum]|nr:hypothetical protein KbCgl_18580 [Corynebacterium glutamicum]